MAMYEHLVKSYDVGDEIDAIASADPPAYVRRCFAEGCSAPSLSWNRVQQLTPVQALRRALDRSRPEEPEAAAELEQLAGSLEA